MSLRRFIVDLHLPEDQNGNLPAALFSTPTPAQLSAMASMTWFQIIATMIRRLKSYSAQPPTNGPAIQPDIAKSHRCYHDETPFRECEAQEDI